MFFHEFRCSNPYRQTAPQFKIQKLCSARTLWIACGTPHRMALLDLMDDGVTCDCGDSR